MIAPLEGIRVLELASFVAAPSAAALMADMGADVVKIEPIAGDGMRGMVRRPWGPEADPAVDYAFELDNRGKRGVAIAYDRPAGAALVRELVAGFDFFVTNLPPVARRQFALDVADIRAANPRVIDLAISGYGPDGPGAGRLGFDNNAFWCASGAVSFFRPQDQPPILLQQGQGDHATALNLLATAMIALRLRDRTGEGQAANVTLFETGIWTISSQFSAALVDRRPPPPGYKRAATNPLSRMYQTGDGRWFLFSMPQSDRYWPGFCRALERPDWFEDARFATFVGRAAHIDELVALIKDVIGAHELAHWAPRFDAERLTWAPAAVPHEVVDDPVARHLGIFQPVDHPHTTPFETVGAPFHIAGADIRIRGGAPRTGEHTHEVLREAGLDEDRIAALAADGVFG